jgi:hypothetical protein
MIIIYHDGKVAININKVIIQHNMKLKLYIWTRRSSHDTFLRVPRRFESIVNITRIITWQHDTHEPQRHHEWPQLTTWSMCRARSYLALVPSSTWMPRRTFRGWPDTIPYNIHKEVRYRPTCRHTKLLSLRDPVIPYVALHNQVLVHLGSTDADLNRLRQGYHLGAPNFLSRPHSALPINYSPFFPNCLARSQFRPTSLQIHLNHTGPPSIEKTLLRANSNHLSSIDSLHN